MALTINTNIKNEANGYSLDASQVKGGYVVVANQDERDAIPAATKVNGTTIYQADVGKEYRWDETKDPKQWIEVVTSGVQNIENGSGVKSIQQVKNTDGTTIPIKTKNPNAVAQGAPEEVEIGATGESAAVFGGAAAATAKRALAAGTNTAALGKYSAAFGDNSVALGNESFSAGYATVTKGAHSAGFGENNQALADNVFIAGQNSKHEGMNGASFGQSNIGHFKNSILLGYGVEDSAENQTLVGYNYIADTDVLFQASSGGEGLKVTKNGLVIATFGGYSTTYENYNYQVVTPAIISAVISDKELSRASFYQSILIGRSGIGHTDIKPTTLSIGQNNTITDGKERIAVTGNQHSIDKDDTVAFGWALQSNNRTDSNSYTEALFGHYNKISDNVLLQVGNGTGENRSNAFEVFNDGRAKVQTAPKDNDDVTRKGDFKTINGNSLLGSGDLTVAGGGTEVTPNPTLSGSEAALSALQIGDTKYRIEGTLTTLMVGIDSSFLGG